MLLQAIPGIPILQNIKMLKGTKSYGVLYLIREERFEKYVNNLATKTRVFRFLKYFATPPLPHKPGRDTALLPVS